MCAITFHVRTLTIYYIGGLPAGGQPKPLSLVTMMTHEHTTASAEEEQMRARAIQMGEQFSKDSDSLEAVIEITRVLEEEGMSEIDVEESVGLAIEDELMELCGSSRHLQRIVNYHKLLWKAAGHDKWILERKTGESRVEAYLPRILLATQMRLSVETAIGCESLAITEEQCSSNQFGDPEWTEVSLLEFLNSTVEAKQQVAGLCSQPVCQVITSKERKLAWRDATDSDNIRGELLFESENEKEYVRTESDVRVLYELRPNALNAMPLGQFAAEYAILHRTWDGYERALNSVNPDTCLGPESTCKIAGSELYAPHCFKLSNQKIMKRRETKSILMFQSNDSTDGYLSELLWSKWTKLEEVTGEQDEEETQEQKQTRLDVFPLSVFPVHE